MKERMIAVIVLNTLIVAAELLAGIWSGSTALQADAIHNLGDVLGIGVALAAVIVSSRKPTRGMTFGYIRAEMMAGFINSLTLIGGMVFIAVESVQKIFRPQEVNGTAMMLAAGVALAANLFSVFLLKGHGHAHHHGHAHGHGHQNGPAGACPEDEHPREDMNLKAASLHLLSDAGLSLAVIAGGLFINLTGITYADPVLSMLFVAFIMLESVRILKVSFKSLMDAGDPLLSRIEEAVKSEPGVIGLHDLHITRPSSQGVHFSAHLVLEGDPSLSSVEKCLEAVRVKLKSLGVTHSLLQPESSRYLENKDWCQSHHD